VIALDTNILVYAHREDSAWHERADSCFAGIVASGRPWAVPWPCVHEFLSITTNGRIYTPPTPLDLALEQIESWLEAPNLTVLSETTGYWSVFRVLLRQTGFTGPKIHDVRIAALCLHNGASEIWTADRDFRRFADLRVVNPLIDD
jgi:toxin-antitoxin system PIN domain toxin